MVVLVIVLLGGYFWVHISAPCDTFKYTPAKNVPARCFMHR
jgi:hypothetical protein